MRPLQELATQIGETLLAQGNLLALAESCTGGLAAASITDLAGSSAWFDSSVVVYSNQAKQDLLKVPVETLAQYGAVSEPVARAMAAGAQAHAPVQLAVAVTGVAGPGGGSAGKPVGTVWFGWATPQGVFTERQRFDGDRAAVRRATVAHALAGLLQRLP